MEIEHNEENQTRTLDELPEKFRRLFSSYPCFNAVQSQVFDDIFESNQSVVVAAPTGSGKTVVFELAITKVLMDLDKMKYKNDFKMIYISPVKALCRERFNDWNPRFSSLGVSCIEVTGDGDDYFNLRGSNIIITTPEKWDSLTRRWRDNASLVQLVKLFMLDEVHLLSDSKRGPVLEAVVSRMKTVSKAFEMDCVRFVAVSATIYNVEDLALWLGNKNGPAVYHKFGIEVRPVHLQKIVKGYQISPSQSAFLFDIQLSYKLKALIFEYAKGRPTLVFCSTRKSVIQTAKILSEQLSYHFSDFQRGRLCSGSSSLTDNKLKDLVLRGVGYHHAGMSVGDKHAVQGLFMAGSLPILVATSTLAMGVNLPAHLVIIKSTQQYIAGRVEEYSESAILQMIGRAGRPQYDTTATAIIMTKSELVQKYERLLDSKEIIESNFHLHLPEHLNSEIVLFTITNLGVAMEWIRSTFLYVRALKNPKHYGFGADTNHERIERCLETICMKGINCLEKAELVNIDNERGISPTAYGRLMSYYYLSFGTFKIFLDVKGSETMSEILEALSQAEEFSEVQLRTNEKRTLNDLNRNKNRETIRFPLQGRIKNRSMKVNCLIQASLGCLPILDPALLNESMRIVRLAERLCKCLSDILSKKKHHGSLLNAALLTKCLHARLWENTPFVCRQLERIGSTSASLLASCGKTSFQAIEESNPRDLERIVNRAPPFGNVLQDAVHHLPKYDIKLENERMNTLCYRTVVTVSLLNPDVIKVRNTAGNRHWVTLIVGDTDNNLLSYTRITDQTLTVKDLQISVVSKYPKLPHKIFANLVSDQWVGIDVSAEIVIVGAVQTASDGQKSPARRKRKVQNAGKKESDAFKKFLEENKAESREKFVDPYECCFDVDVVVIDDTKFTSSDASHSLSFETSSKDFEVAPETFFNSVEPSYDRLKGINNAPLERNRSGYFTGCEFDAKRTFFFKE